MFVVSLLSAFFLSSIVTLQQSFLMLVLIAVFLGTGFFVRRNVLNAYLALIFLYPLIPSVPSQIGLPDFNYHEFLFLSFAFWWAVKNIWTGNLFRNRPMATLITLLLVSCAFSTCLSLVRSNFVFSNIFLLKLSERWNIFQPWSQLDALSSLRFFLNLPEGVLFYFITLDVIKIRENVWNTLHVFIASAVCVSVLGILQYAFDFRPLVAWTGQMISTRVNSTFSDANSLGTFLSAVFMIGVAQFFSVDKRVRWRYLLAMGAVLLCLIFTGSRAAWGATCLTLLFLSLIAARTGVFEISFRERGTRAGLVSMVLLLIVLFGALMVAGSFTLSSLSAAYQGSRGYIDSILMGRISVWTAGWDVFTENPVFGVGPGSFPRFLDKYQGVVPALYAHENAHNYYLQLLAETGVIGTVLFLTVVGISIWKAIQFLRNQKIVSDPTLAMYGLLSAILVVLLTSITGHPLLLVKLQYFFWGTLGMIWILLSNKDTGQPFKRKRIVALVVGLVILVFGPIEAYSILKSRQLLPYEFGFYDWEKDASGPFRWTKDKAVSQIRVENEVLKISLRQINAKVLRKPVVVDLFVNGRLMDRVTLTDAAWSEFRYYLLDSKVKDLLTIQIDPDAVFTPSKMSQSSDSRNLGTTVRPFEWESKILHPAGVYNQEVQAGRKFVWTRMQASFPMEPSGKTLQLPIFYNNPRTPGQKVRFFWNRHLIKEALIHNRGWQEVALQLPSGSNKGILTVVAASTWNPGRSGLGTDFRELGVGVGEFQWKEFSPQSTRRTQSSQ